MNKEVKNYSNVSLLLGILILVTIVATSAIFSNQAFADSGSKVKTYLEGLKKQAEQKAKAAAEKKALEEQQAREEAEKKALEEQQAKEEAESAVQEDIIDTSGDSSDTTSEDQTAVQEDVGDTSGDSSGTTPTEVSNEEEANSETNDVGQTPVNNDNDIPVIIEEVPIEADVEPQVEMHVALDHIEDSRDGKMVYLHGDGARESARITITIFGENNDEIVELGIYATNRGEFSTIWIANEDMNIDGTYLVKASDNQNNAETAFKLNGEIVEIITEETPVDNIGLDNIGLDNINSLKKASQNPNIELKQKVNILESLVSAMQGIITSLSISLQNYQSQIDEETKARQTADEELKGKLNEISAKPYKLVAYERAMYITVQSGDQSSHTITCPEGDVAQNGGIDIKSDEVTHFKTFVNRMEGTDSWHVQASNTNPSESVEMTLYVNCLRVESTIPTSTSESEQIAS